MKNFPTVSVFLMTISLLLVSCRAAPYECTDPLGCLEIPPDSPLVVGAILATTGQKGPAGTESLQSVENAVVDKVEFLNHPIKLIHYGTDCTEESARTAATEFATYTDLSGVIGPTCTGEAVVAVPILRDAGIPLLGPVPNSETALALVEQVFTAIEQVAVKMPDGTLFIPRQALFDVLQTSP